MSHRRGFTLIELLVVIAIIALLVSILLPSLQGAKWQAIRTRCQTNMHHMTLGASMYAAEYGKLPPNNPQRGYLPSIVYSPLHFPGERSGLLAMENSKFFERANLACPEGWSSEGRPDFYSRLDPTDMKSVNMDYIYWGARYKPPQSGKYDVRYDSLAYEDGERGVKVLITDAVTETSGSNPWPRSRKGAGNHDWGKPVLVDRTDGKGGTLGNKVNRIVARGGSVGFVDGHVEWLEPQRFTQAQSGLCYPARDQW